MKLDANKIFNLSSKFTGVFFVLAQENNSFLDCLLALIYSVKTISKIAVKLDVITEKEINEIDGKLSEAADNDLENNMAHVGSIVEELKKHNWEIKNDNK